MIPSSSSESSSLRSISASVFLPPSRLSFHFPLFPYVKSSAAAAAAVAGVEGSADGEGFVGCADAAAAAARGYAARVGRRGILFGRTRVGCSSSAAAAASLPWGRGRVGCGPFPNGTVHGSCHPPSSSRHLHGAIPRRVAITETNPTSGHTKPRVVHAMLVQKRRSRWLDPVQ